MASFMAVIHHLLTANRPKTSGLGAKPLDLACAASKELVRAGTRGIGTTGFANCEGGFLTSSVVDPQPPGTAGHLAAQRHREMPFKRLLWWLVVGFCWTVIAGGCWRAPAEWGGPPEPLFGS